MLHVFKMAHKLLKPKIFVIFKRLKQAKTYKAAKLIFIFNNLEADVSTIKKKHIMVNCLNDMSISLISFSCALNLINCVGIQVGLKTLVNKILLAEGLYV